MRYIVASELPVPGGIQEQIMRIQASDEDYLRPGLSNKNSDFNASSRNYSARQS